MCAQKMNAPSGGQRRPWRPNARRGSCHRGIVQQQIRPFVARVTAKSGVPGLSWIRIEKEKSFGIKEKGHVCHDNLVSAAVGCAGCDLREASLILEALQHLVEVDNTVPTARKPSAAINVDIIKKKLDKCESNSPPIGFRTNLQITKARSVKEWEKTERGSSGARLCSGAKPGAYLTSITENLVFKERNIFFWPLFKTDEIKNATPLRRCSTLTDSERDGQGGGGCAGGGRRAAHASPSTYAPKVSQQRTSRVLEPVELV
ncbi:hypothetical protein EVAR_31810_1 [Eumeta japonica]|uniref:Uncharacterized protein n=1 Tax=Eumeta variegata TaxID=151549 RepID=A0A4C1W4H7_EUMVA|nr:hypothetical protein EVAR_31810_1 [Eumeta japonica]